MRRLSALVLVALATLLLLPAAAVAATDAGEVAVLAVDDAPSGPNPAPRDAEDNPARDLGDYVDRDVPFTWGAAWLLSAAGLIGLVTMLAFYRFRVAGPAKDRASS